MDFRSLKLPSNFTEEERENVIDCLNRALDAIINTIVEKKMKLIAQYDNIENMESNDKDVTIDDNSNKKSETNNFSENDFKNVELKRRKKSRHAKSAKKHKSGNESDSTIATVSERTVTNSVTNPQPSTSRANTDDQTNDELSSEDEKVPAKERIPPLLINSRDNEGLTCAKLRQIHAKLDIFPKDAKINKSGVYRIVPESSEDHRKLTKAYDAHGIKFHTYMLPQDKHLKVVIRGVDPAESTEAIKAEVAKNYPVVNVSRMFSNRTGIKKPILLVMVELSNNKEGHEIYNLRYLMYLRIQVESLKKKTSPGQCHRCQRFGHAASCCHLTPRCVSCGVNHLSNKCDKDKTKTPPKCANCHKAHPANYKGCEKYPKFPTKRPAPTQANNPPKPIAHARAGVSYAQAAATNQKDIQSGTSLTTLLTVQQQLVASPESLRLLSNVLNGTNHV